VFLKSGDRTNVALLSILLSLMSTAYTVFMMFYEKDTDTQCRKETPSFYGVIPVDGRAIFVSLFVFIIGLTQTMAKTLSTALLWTIRPLWFVIYCVINYMIFIGYKLFRNDFLYWVPMEGNGKYVIATLIRNTVKLITDYTGLMLTRHSYDCGGAYFTFNAFTTQVSNFAITYLFYKYSEDADKIPMLYPLFSGLFFVWLISYVLFLFLIDSKYRQTFYSFKTGYDFNKAYFLDNDEDEKKVIIFGCQQSHWIDIAPDVEIWSHSKWAEWKATKPEWFTDNFIASVPDRYIPKDAVVELNRVAGGQRRRSSVRNSLLSSFLGSPTDNGAGFKVSRVPVVVVRDDNILASDSNIGRVTVRSLDNNLLVRRD